jgi:dihydroorotate dehydrogenase
LKTVIEQQGGLSGRPLHERSVSFVRHAHERLQGRLSIIGVGGIATTEDVLDMFRAGADAVQIYTGLIYEGPGLVAQLNEGLLAEMTRRGCSTVAELKAGLRGTFAR